MNEQKELDLRTVIAQREPVRCTVSPEETYEVRLEVHARRGRGGSTTQLAVVRSADGGETWESVRFRRNWRRQWWAIVKDGLGGGYWPPRGDDFKAAYVRDGRLKISYLNLWELGSERQAYVWEMGYDARADWWDVVLLEEIPPESAGHDA